MQVEPNQAVPWWKLTLNEKRQNKRFDQKSRIVTITHPISKDFYGLDAQVDNLTFLTASLSTNSWNPTT